MNLLDNNVISATLVDLDEMAGLIPQHVTTQAELNEWEQANIIQAKLWFSHKSLKPEQILDQGFLKKIHQKMFGKTWKWAGKFRKTDKNIGCDWREIPVRLKQLFDDINFQLIHNTYSIDEIAARFHHRLVFIHPFANGNGRLSRFITDLLLLACRRTTFSWGSINNAADIREQYIKALRAADRYDYAPLIQFVRS